MSVHAFMFISALVFCIGLLTVLIRKNLIFVLMGIELMLNAANINLIAFSQSTQSVSGQIFTIFVIVIAAAEAAIGLAIALALWRSFKTINIDEVNVIIKEQASLP